VTDKLKFNTDLVDVRVRSSTSISTMSSARN